MNQREIDNRLIAEFMKCSNPFNEINDATLYKVEQGTFELGELKYHTSWDWLMPVLKKINLQLNPNNYSSWRMIYKPTEYYLQDVYAQAVQFIKWYKKHNNDN